MLFPMTLGPSSFEGGCISTILPEKRLREKCPNTEIFLVRNFLVLCPNTGKYGPEKTPYLDTFHTVEDTRTVLNFRLKFGRC